MPSTQLTFDPVDVIRLNDCTPEQFFERYVKPGRPCIIEDFADDWPAHGKWSPQYFKEAFGDTIVRFHHLQPGSPHIAMDKTDQTTMADFITRLEQGDRIKHFSFSHAALDFIATHPTMIDDVRPETVRNLMPDTTWWGLHPLDHRFWPWVPPYPPQFFIAGHDTLTLGHYDYDASHTFHWCVSGRKSVKLFPYMKQMLPAYEALKYLDLTDPLPPEVFRKHPELRTLRGWSATLQSGQTLFMPCHMWHFFKNHELSMSFLLRSRSFDTLEGYCAFANDEQGPVESLPGHIQIWRLVSFGQRDWLGKLMTTFPRLVIGGTKLWIGFLNMLNRSRRSSTTALFLMLILPISSSSHAFLLLSLASPSSSRCSRRERRKVWVSEFFGM